MKELAEMLPLQFLLLLAMASMSVALRCFYPCSCEENYMDCTSANLNTTLDLSSWLNTSYNKDTLQKIILDRNNLVHVRPLPALEDLRYLSFRGNRIQKIEDSSFAYLQNLSELDLSDNGILSTNLQADAFRGIYQEQEFLPLEGLKILRLGGNELHTLRSDLFEHTPHLQVLTLDRNPFFHLDVPTVQAITSLIELQVLDLSYTHISVIPQYMLHTPKYLRELNLTGNAFTNVPEELAHTHNMTILKLTANPITTITAETGFPAALGSLRVLEMNWMTELKRIEKGAMSTLTSLEEFYCSHNHKLAHIDADAFRHDITEDTPHMWPPMKKLHLRSNELSSLDEGLLGNWEVMEEIDIEDNNWMCDCNNQWIVSKLELIINRTKPEYTRFTTCKQPEEMRGKRMFDLEVRHYHMRCLDADGNHPERDGMLLIGVLVGVLLAVPATVALVLFFRHRIPWIRSGPAAYSRAFYNAADDY
ncbi:leucine-rich repeat neuronal protein 1 [Anabrus simplex]|uniref:leucine-rich repeat neuronal protein 1 n=1 Tax=Anabrus simplex TaxID=316456 RepID=UPI0035A321D9